MATFNRFTQTPTKRAPVEDDEDELKAIAAKRLGTTQPAPKAVAPPAPKAAPKPAPALPKVTAAPVVKTPPRPVAQPAPVAVQAPPRAPVDAVGTTQTSAKPVRTGAATGSVVDNAATHRAALDLLEQEDKGGGGVSMADGYEKLDDGIGEQKKKKDGAQTSAYSFINTETPKEEDARRAEAKRKALAERKLREMQEANPGGMGEELQDDLGGNGGADRNESDVVDFDADLGANDDGRFGDKVDGTDANDVGFIDGALGEVSDNGTDDLADVARKRLEAEMEKEREAAAAELKAGKAKALMMANARAQLAGMGLSGSTAALESDISRTQDRSATLAMADLGRRQRDEGRDDRRLTADEKRADADAEFTKLRRQMAIDLLEEQGGQDVDNDGDIGGVPIAEFNQEEEDAENAANDGAADAARNPQPGTVPVTDEHRIPLNGSPPNNVPLENYQSGSTYLGSSDAYDFYEKSNGSLYKVRRT